MNKIYGKLAKNNIVNNRQLYVPYILSGMMTAALFYVMNFLCKNPGLDRIPGSAALGTILALGVDVIGIFAYIFIFYTNSFISKHRKKELGIYNILGMEKKHIARVLFLETLFVAVCAIGGGLFVGIAFSKLMVMLLYRILRVTETVSFMIYQPGIRSTVIAFGILYLLTFLYNLMQLKLSNPIELLHGSSAGEKEPKAFDDFGRDCLYRNRILYCNYYEKSPAGAFVVLWSSHSGDRRNLFPVYGRKHCLFEASSQK